MVFSPFLFSLKALLHNAFQEIASSKKFKKLAYIF